MFGLDGVQWLLWRHAADPLPNTSFEQARAALEASGARLEREASFHEVLWENRPELQWHRFPSVGYPFAPSHRPRRPPVPDAAIFRVVRPGDSP